MIYTGVLLTALIGFLYFVFLPASSSCLLSEVRYQEGDFTVQLSRYGGEKSSEKSILILPPTGGATILDRSYARQFCAAGFDVYIFQKWTDDDEYSTDLEIHQRFYSRAQRAIALVLQNINSSYIGLLGTSVGALHAANAASLQDRLNAVFLIVGGAPIAQVIVDSDQQAMLAVKAKRFERYHFKSEAEYLSALTEALSVDPFHLPKEFQKKDLGMILAERDLTVPTRNQLALRDLWQPQSVTYLTGGHMWVIVKTWLTERTQIQKFFEESFRKSLKAQ